MWQKATSQITATQVQQSQFTSHVLSPLIASSASSAMHARQANNAQHPQRTGAGSYVEVHSSTLLSSNTGPIEWADTCPPYNCPHPSCGWSGPQWFYTSNQLLVSSDVFVAYLWVKCTEHHVGCWADKWVLYTGGFLQPQTYGYLPSHKALKHFIKYISSAVKGVFLV